MRILKSDLKRGVVKVKIENLDDIWVLKHVLEKGDLVTGKTFRKKIIKRGEKIEYGERIPMVLKIKVEDVEFQKESGNLRITGKIVSGPESIQLHSYHTIQAEPGKILLIQKEWKKYQIEKLKKAQIKKPLLLIGVIDREEMDFGILKESGIEMISSFYPEKEEEDRRGFYKKILDYLKGKKEFEKIIIAGPGFERENLFNYIKERDKELTNKIILEHSSDVGISGVKEVIKKSANKILRETRIAKETELIEEVLKRIKTNGLVVYGREDTEKAINYGAVESLIVSEEKIREFENLMEKTEKMGGKVFIVSSEHESGEQFLNLGGIAAFLRYKI